MGPHPFRRPTHGGYPTVRPEIDGLRAACHVPTACELLREALRDAEDREVELLDAIWHTPAYRTGS